MAKQILTLDNFTLVKNTKFYQTHSLDLGSNYIYAATEFFDVVGAYLNGQETNLATAAAYFQFLFPDNPTRYSFDRVIREKKANYIDVIAFKKLGIYFLHDVNDD